MKKNTPYQPHEEEKLLEIALLQNGERARQLKKWAREKWQKIWFCME